MSLTDNTTEEIITDSKGSKEVKQVARVKETKQGKTGRVAREGRKGRITGTGAGKGFSKFTKTPPSLNSRINIFFDNIAKITFGEAGDLTHEQFNAFLESFSRTNKERDTYNEYRKAVRKIHLLINEKEADEKLLQKTETEIKRYRDVYLIFYKLVNKWLDEGNEKDKLSLATYRLEIEALRNPESSNVTIMAIANTFRNYTPEQRTSLADKMEENLRLGSLLLAEKEANLKNFMQTVKTLNSENLELLASLSRYKTIMSYLLEIIENYSLRTFKKYSKSELKETISEYNKLKLYPLRETPEGYYYKAKDILNKGKDILITPEDLKKDKNLKSCFFSLPDFDEIETSPAVREKLENLLQIL